MNKHQLIASITSLLVVCGIAAAAPSKSHRQVPHAAPPTIASSTWTNIGPNNVIAASVVDNGPGAITGRINSVATDPFNPSIMYVGAAGGGVWKSTDSGFTWSSMSDEAPWTASTVNVVAINPVNDQEVWAGTGDLVGFRSNPQLVGSGIMKSVDGGVTWTNIAAGLFGGLQVTAILFDPETPSTVTVATAGGTNSTPSEVWQSTDDGNSFAPVITTSADWQSISAGVLNNGQRIYYAIGGATGGGGILVYTSANRGATWTAATPPTVGSNETGLGIAASAVGATTVYAASAADKNVWISVNGANTWTAINNGGIDTAAGPTILLGVEATSLSSGSPVDAVYSGKHTLHVTINGGTNWYDLAGADSAKAKMSVGPLSMAFFAGSPNTSLVASDQGVYELVYTPSSSGSGNVGTFSSLNNALNVAFVNKAAFDPLNSFSGLASFPADSIGGPGSAAFSNFAPGSWQGVPGGADCAINQTNSGEQYTAATSGSQAIVYQTFDSWSDSVAVPLPVVSGDKVPPSPVIAFDPVDSILYLGTQYLNAMSSPSNQWTTQLGNQRLTAANDSITAIAIAPTNPDIIYTGSASGQVWMSQNQGSSWTRIDGGSNPLPTGVSITSISVNPDPTNNGAANDVLVTDGTATLGHVFHCLNTAAGASVSWADLSSNLPSAAYYTVARDVDNPGSSFYVGCDFGMYYSLNSGATWANGTRPLGLPIVPVSELVAVPATRFLNAATVGRGVWQIAFPPPTPTITSVTPNSGVVNVADIPITVVGTGYYASSTVYFNSSPLATTFLSSTTLDATIPVGLLTTAGPQSITVVNAAPGGASAAATFTVTNPTAAITSLSPSGVVVGSAAFTLTVNGSGFYSGSVVQWNGSAVPTTYVSSNILTALIPQSDLTQLTTVPVTVANAGVPVSNALIFTVGNPLPVAQVLSPSSVSAGSASLNLVISGHGFISGSTVNWQSVTLQTTTTLPATLINGQLDVTVPASLLASGQVVSVSVTNPTPGGGTSAPLTFIVSNTVPTISSVSPSAVGAGSSNLSLTIAGGNFAQGVLISVNGIIYTPTSSSSNSATVMIPATAMAVGGYYPVFAINPAPGGGASTSLTFEVDNPIPVTTAVTPNTAAAGSSAQSIAVTGSGFVQTSIVEWNGQPLATSFGSGGSLTAIVPLADLATGNVGSITVVTPAPAGGTSAELQFVVTNPVPTLVSVSPNGATTGGPDLTVFLTGTNFVPGSVVTWNGTTTLASTFIGPTTLQVIVPAALISTAGTGSITVANPAPSGGVTGSVSILISNGVPTVTGLSPQSTGINAPTFTMTVTGSNFASGATVQWTPLTTTTSAPQTLTTSYISGSQLTAVVPASLLAAAGTATVSVTNQPPGGGVSSIDQTFTINNPVPILATLSPTTGLAGASNIVLTLGGSNFVQTSVVTLGNVQLPTTFVSPDLLTATVPQSLVETAGQTTISVLNPTPGGGKSGVLTFSIVPVHTYPAGLQMLSAPYDYSNTTFSALLGLTDGTVAIWEPLLQEYAINPLYPADTMRLGQSYWARLPQAETLQVQGVPAPHGQKYAIPVVPTWNQISDPFPAPVLMSTLTVTETGGSPVTFAAASQPAYNVIYPTVYSYDTTNHVYVAHYIGNPIEPDPVLSPYVGYWLAAKTSCTINVTPPTGF